MNSTLKLFITFLLWASGLTLCLTPYILTWIYYPVGEPNKLYIGPLSNELRMIHLTGMLASIPPLGLYLYFTRKIFKRFETSLRQTKKETYTPLVILTFLVGLFGSYIFALLGQPVPTRYVPMFEATPIALALMVMGLVGMFLMANSFRHRNPNPQKAWAHLFLGFFLIVLSYIYLEALLLWTWGT